MNSIEYPNTAFYVELEAIPEAYGSDDYSYCVVAARKESTDQAASAVPALVPLCNLSGEPQSGRVAFWFVLPGSTDPNGDEPIFQWFATALETSRIVAACRQAEDWMKRKYIVT